MLCRCTKTLTVAKQDSHELSWTFRKRFGGFGDNLLAATRVAAQNMKLRVNLIESKHRFGNWIVNRLVSSQATLTPFYYYF
jgi:hypothetical protein